MRIDNGVVACCHISMRLWLPTSALGAGDVCVLCDVWVYVGGHGDFNVGMVRGGDYSQFPSTLAKGYSLLKGVESRKRGEMMQSSFADA